MKTENILDYFFSEFNNYANNTAVIWKDKSFSYAYISEIINHWRDELDKIVYKGMIVALEGDFSPDSISILFVLIEKKAIIVPLDINHKNKNQKKYEIAQIDIIIRINNNDGVDFEIFNDKENKNELFNLVKDKPGLVLFTSGSSGEPKAVLHDFSKLLQKFKTKRTALKTINFLLFDHGGGLNTLFHILANGGTVIILENRTPNHVCKIIEKYKVELLPTSPTFLNMLLLSKAYMNYDLSSLKIISYGAEPMPESLLIYINKIFPNIKFKQTYGLNELGTINSKSESNNSLWLKIGGVGCQVRVIDDMLQIKSDSAMIGYLNAQSPFTEDGWFMTGDKVEVKGDYFKILGRKSEIINVGGEKVFPQEVENAILEIDGVADVVVFGEDNRLTGKIVCAKVSYKGRKEKSEIIKIIKTHCRAKLHSYKVPIKILFDNNILYSDRFKKKRI
jgi:long-chain acyl-CoA synthetase